MSRKQPYCQVGEHPMSLGQWVYACHVCGVTFCYDHKVSDRPAGEYVACPDHVEEADAISKDLLRRQQAHIARRRNRLW